MATATQTARAAVLLASPATTAVTVPPTTLAMTAGRAAWQRIPVMGAASVLIEQERASALNASPGRTVSNAPWASMAALVRCTVMRTRHATATEPACRTVFATAATLGG
eukprot:COSAG02_NODE_3019_length_7535_cov_9.178456_3_plen_109_part_00